MKRSDRFLRLERAAPVAGLLLMLAIGALSAAFAAQTPAATTTAAQAQPSSPPPTTMSAQPPLP